MHLEWKVHIRAYPGMPRGGDVGLVLPREHGAIAALIDAAGHGLQAYSVAQTARRTLLQSEESEPEKLLYMLDDVLKNTIGAAISVARIGTGTVEFAGVGNVEASIDLSPLLIRTGIVGQRMRRPRVVTTSFGPNQWLLMHTDGVSSPRALPTGNADTVARKLVDTYGSLHDDAGVLLARWREDAP